MNAEAKRAIEWDCQQVLTRFINYFDARDYPALANLFTADGQWFRPGGPARGFEGILAALTARPDAGDLTIRHVISNIVVDVIDDNHAEAMTYLTVYRHEGTRNGSAPVPLNGAYMVGLSVNKLTRKADGWRISEKHTTRIFERTAS